MDTVKTHNKIFNYLIVFIISMFAMICPTKVFAQNDVILTFTDTSIKETVSGSGYIITGTSLEITKGGTYRIKGSCSEGNISVKKGIKNVNLILDNLNLTSEKTAPLVVKKDGAEVTLWLLGESTLTSNEDPANEFSEDPDIADAYEGAVIKVKSKSSLTIRGTGSLNVVGSTYNGIKGGSTSSITVEYGVINIDAENNGLSCDGTIDLKDGYITINAKNEGIKLEPDEGDYDSLAKLTINEAKVVVNSGQDGIQAMGDIIIDGWAEVIVNSLEDGIQTRSNFTMTNGNLNITTFEGSNTLNFDPDVMSAKGIKAGKIDEEEQNASNTINITGGTININSSDDAIHSDGYINITRGTVIIKSGDDGIHADTRLVIGTLNGLERDPEIDVQESVEGIEAGNIYVYSGKIKVNAIDDGMNAAGGASSGSSKGHGEHFNPDTGQMEDNFALYVYGGSIFVDCDGDGLDANGSIYLYGGTQIIYHQDAQGNNSALDRDAKLVIDGATVFAAGGVADNGMITSSGSSQEIIVDTTDYAANSKIAIEDGGNILFNDQIPKRSTYTFYSSPSLTSNASITTVVDLEDDVLNPWKHTWNDGVIVTPATESTPGVMSYTCAHGGLTERKTYFYSNEVTFSFINRTNEGASVRIGSTTKTVDFTTTEVDEVFYVTTTKDVDVITSKDGINFYELRPNSTVSENVYSYIVNPSVIQTIYIVYDGDVNLDGLTDIDDSTMIARSLISSTDPRYNEFDEIQKILADTNDDGLINSHDGLAVIKELTGNVVYDESYFGITSIDPVVLDGEHDGEATVSFLTKKDIIIDAMDGRYSPSQEKPDSNGYIELVDIDGAKSDDVEYALVDVVNGFAGAVDTNGLEIPKDTVLVTLKYKVDKDTPTGVYPVKLRIDSVTAHDSQLDASFTLTADVIVKGTSDPRTAFFNKDEGVDSIDVYYTQNYNGVDEEDVSSTAVRDPDTGGIIGATAEGQVNFTVNLKDGYVIKSITATPVDNYNKIKGPGETEKKDTYRVTKITGDIEITIETKQATEYTVTFEKDKNISKIDVYYTHDYTTPDELNVLSTFVRNGDTGEIDLSGDGQVNFKVSPKPDYKVDSIKVVGGYKNIKEQEDRIYRVTKITSDVTIIISSSKRTAITPIVSGYEESYVYTGKAIKPTPVVTFTTGDPEETITLVNDVDYTVTYGENKNVGENAGSIIITSKVSSDYSFEPIEVNFDITQYELKESNITVPSQVVYTGNALTPNVSVSHNGKTLTEGTDYDVEYTNQNGSVGENVIVKVIGKGNFKGTIDGIEVYITDKENQIIEFDVDSVTKVYGDNFTKTATLIKGDGTIRYVSNNTEAAIVDVNTGAVTLVGTGSATIRAFASETATYAETVASYKVIVKKADITLESLTVSDKSYDGNKTAIVTDVQFGGLVNNETLVRDVDYTVDAEYIDKEIGNDKQVNVTVNLSTETIKRYSLRDNTYETTANITTGIITSDSITLNEDTFTYNGSEIEPEVIVVVGGNTLVEGTDYKVDYYNNTNAGTGTVVVTGIGNFASGTSVDKTFTINKKNVTPTIEEIPNVVYDGGEKRPKLNVTDGSDTLVEDVDYTTEYDDNTNAGTGSVKIYLVPSSNYVFDDTTNNTRATFIIEPYELKSEDITLEYNIVEYDGNAKEPLVTVIANKIPLTEDINYTVTYSNNVNIGTGATVTVNSIDTNYTGSPKVYFEIIDKEILVISGINDNQSIPYTGNPVVLSGELIVYPNTGNIEPEDLTVKYYNSSDEEIERPTNVGKYYVIYSYDDNDYIGSLKVNFEITKATSVLPGSISDDLVGIQGDKLSTITLDTEGLSWDDGNTTLTKGDNSYSASFTTNNDTENYTTVNLEIPVYAKSKININTSVSGAGGTISGSEEDVIEGTSKTVTFTPSAGFVIQKVTVNGDVVAINNNELNVTAGTEDMNIVVTYDAITYELNISSSKNAVSDPNGIITVNYNSNKTIDLSPKYGYKLTSVKVNGVEMINSVLDGTLTLTNINSDANIVVKAEKIGYVYIAGARQTYTINKDTKAEFEINAEYSLFNPGGKVYVDDELVDTQNYTSKEGSTIIIFNKRYLDSLSVGTHTLNVIFNNGGEAATTFDIAKINYEQKTTPKNNTLTGDNIVYVIIILIISLIGLLIGAIYRKNKSKKDRID